MRYILLNRIIFNGHELRPGKELDDNAIDVASIVAAGGQLATLPNAVVEERAAALRKQHEKGLANNEALEMFSATSDTTLAAGGDVPATRVIGSGAGLTGGGNLSTDRTLVVGAHADGSIVVNADDVQVGVLATDTQHGLRGGGTQHAAVVSGGASGFMTGAQSLALDALLTGAVPNTRLVVAGAGLTGGGDLSADRTFNAVGNADGSIVANANDLQVGVLATDAQHGLRGGGTQHTNATVAVAGFMTAADFTKLGGVAAGATNTPLTAVAPVDVTKAAAAAGVSTDAAKADHKHDVTTAAPADVGSANAEGAASSLSRSDHVHNLTSAVANAATAFGLTAGSVPFVAAGPTLSEDNTGLFYGAADNQLGVNTNAFPTTSLKLRVGNTAGLTDGLTQLDGATNQGITKSGARFNSASPYLSLVIGSYIDSAYDGGGNGGLYAIARVGAGGNPPVLAPFAALSGYDEGTSRSLYFGGGGWGAPDATDLVFYTASAYTETVDTGVQRIHIGPFGQVSIGSPPADTIGHLHVQSAVGSVAFRVSSASPSRIGTGGLNVGTDANPTAGFLFEARGSGGARFDRLAATSGAASNFSYVGAAHTGQTAGTETIDADFNGTATLQHATGALATQRTFMFRCRTYSFVGASTITDAATLTVDGQPASGANATITNAYSLWIQSGKTRLQGAIVADSVISPVALAGTSDNYSPAGLAATLVLRQDCSAASILTGLLALQGGQVITIINLATNVLFTLTLNNEDGASAAGNRFTLPSGAALVIPAGGAVQLWYDVTSARWRPISSV